MYNGGWNIEAEIYYTCPAKYIASDGEKDKLLPGQAITLYPHLTASKKLYNSALSCVFLFIQISLHFGFWILRNLSQELLPVVHFFYELFRRAELQIEALSKRWTVAVMENCRLSNSIHTVLISDTDRQCYFAVRQNLDSF